MFGSLVGTLGEMNPFRYRGYVYDVETGLYYLRSRYYNPEWGRFINADTVLGKVGALGTHNLFAYCGNNPVMMVDRSGKFMTRVATGSTTTLIGNGYDEELNVHYNLYRTTVTYQWVDMQLPMGMYDAYGTVEFEYRITTNGFVLYYNDQPNSISLTNLSIASCLAEAMLKQAQEQVPGALEGRTALGMAIELVIHFIASAVGYKPRNSDRTDMGGTNPNGPGYDYNASTFESMCTNIFAVFSLIF